jgi:DNA-binding transcriptional LysR family regulator
MRVAMNTAYLKTFIEVVNIGSFSKAADKLYITQPAVTKQIKMLENDFGVVLLQRNGTQVIVTKEGQDFYKYATNILNKEEELYAKFCKEEGDISGTLHIYSSSLPANYLLDQILYDFSEKYKNISFNIKKIDSKSVYQHVESGITGFGFTGTKNKRKNIEHIQIAKDELVLAVQADKFGYLKDKEVDINFLLKQEILIRSKGSATLKLFEEAILKENHTMKDLMIKAVIEDNEIIKKMVQKGMGVSVMSRLSIDREVRENLIIPVKIKDMDLTRGIYYIYCKNRYFSSVDEKFKEFIIKNYGSSIK